jgi:hypothetical protein
LNLDRGNLIPFEKPPCHEGEHLGLLFYGITRRHLLPNGREGLLGSAGQPLGRARYRYGLTSGLRTAQKEAKNQQGSTSPIRHLIQKSSPKPKWVKVS